jgi:hypothetical protein
MPSGFALALGLRDPGLHVLFALVAIFLFVDVLTEAAEAVKDRYFSFTGLVAFAREDLVRLIAIVLAAGGAIAAKASADLAIASEKTALVLLLVAVAASISSHLQEVTGIPFAVWDTFLNDVARQDIPPALPNSPPPPAAPSSVPPAPAAAV